MKDEATRPWTEAGFERAEAEKATRDERRVRGEFWDKLRRVAGHIPFAQDAVASYYCATDPATPFRARAILLAALAYFILPFDFIPDAIPVLGFTDDAAVLYAAIKSLADHIKPEHYRKARAALAEDLVLRPEEAQGEAGK